MKVDNGKGMIKSSKGCAQCSVLEIIVAAAATAAFSWRAFAADRSDRGKK